MVIVPIMAKKPLIIYAKVTVGLKQKRKGRQKTLPIPEIKGIRLAAFFTGGCILRCKSHPPRPRKNKPAASAAFIISFLFIIYAILFI